ncbi:ArsR/SmtB family transcription factor [Devosia sp.]|uniref:ArsR/SmtB family transcription factor n=1 Tax=Devosia sp. TaxID=1871048 RepID=UPI003F70286E
MKTREISRIVPDATALKALAHPVRLRMLGMLRIDGPATATRLAERLGLNSGATSYHLRQLAQHGFIEEAPDQPSRRDRWWRARHESTSFFEPGATEEQFDSNVAFAQAALTEQVNVMQRAQDEFVGLPPDWQATTQISDFTMAMTVEQANALKDKLLELLWQAMREAPGPGADLQPGVELYTVMLHAFPYPGRLNTREGDR